MLKYADMSPEARCSKVTEFVNAVVSVVASVEIRYTRAVYSVSTVRCVCVCDGVLVGKALY